MKNLYKGFSSQEYERTKTFVLKDVELVKRDLMNHIFTRKGERVKMSSFGTRIPDLVFEPLDDITLSIITEDLTEVFKYDPRVELLNLRVVPFFDEYAVIAYAELRYIELNLNDRFDIRIEFKR